MDYKIIDIEGVGEVYAEKLIAAGINKVSELLEKCAAPKGRKELAEATGISEKLILKWTNHADNCRHLQYPDYDSFHFPCIKPLQKYNKNCILSLFPRKK